MCSVQSFTEVENEGKRAVLRLERAIARRRHINSKHSFLAHKASYYDFDSGEERIMKFMRCCICGEKQILIGKRKSGEEVWERASPDLEKEILSGTREELMERPV